MIIFQKKWKNDGNKINKNVGIIGTTYMKVEIILVLIKRCLM